MTRIAFTGPCTLEGIKYDRDQLVQLLNTTDLSDYNHAPEQAQVIYAAQSAIQKGTNKITHARVMGKEIADYSLLFARIRSDWAESPFVMQRDRLWAQYRMLTHQWRWLHEVSRRHMPRDYPIVELAKVARAKKVMLLVNESSVFSTGFPRWSVAVVHKGRVLCVVHPRTSDMLGAILSGMTFFDSNVSLPGGWMHAITPIIYGLELTWRDGNGTALVFGSRNPLLDAHNVTGLELPVPRHVTDSEPMLVVEPLHPMPEETPQVVVVGRRVRLDF